MVVDCFSPHFEGSTECKALFPRSELGIPGVGRSLTSLICHLSCLVRTITAKTLVKQTTSIRRMLCTVNKDHSRWVCAPGRIGVTTVAGANPVVSQTQARASTSWITICFLPELKSSHQLPMREKQSQIPGLVYVDTSMCSVRAGVLCIYEKPDSKSQGQNFLGKKHIPLRI